MAASGSVRVRTTAAAVIVVGLTLVVASVVMVVLLRRSLTSDVRDAAFVRAQSVAVGLTVDESGQEIPVGDDEEEFVQLVGPDGEVVASSSNLLGQPAVVQLQPGENTKVDRVPFEDDPFLVVAVASAPPQESTTVLVGHTLESVVESSQTVVRLLVLGIPLLLLIVGFVAWRVVGGALDPVESIRAEVEAISSDQLHRRVPDPPGTDEVARLAATMNRMLERLEGGQSRLRNFVGDASHELRSPLAAIRQHAEVALAHPDQTTAEELASVVLAEGARLQRLVDDLLLLSKMDEGTIRPRVETVDLDDLVFEEAERIRGTPDRSIDAGRVSAGRVSGDKEQLGRLVRNLAENAVRHAKSSVAFSLGESNGRVVLGVDDDGAGVPAAKREQVFERFVRLEEARDRDSGGSGLGLSIVAEIARAHGATVAVLDAPSGGARFEVSFPAIESASRVGTEP